MTSSEQISPLPQAQSVYERQIQAECASFTASFEGSLNALFCIIFSKPITGATREALLATAKRGGFSASDIVWMNTEALEPPDLMHLIEAIDPLCAVVLDQRAAETLSRAYNQPIKLAECDFILGRPCAAFVDFERMLETEERKQQAWSLMKEMLSQTNDV